jgi:hypothetical protein
MKMNFQKLKKLSAVEPEIIETTSFDYKSKNANWIIEEELSI